MKIAFMILMTVVPLLFSKTVVQVLDAPDANISGLAWGNGCLWALSAASGTVYSLDPASGEVLGSFSFQYTEDLVPTGLAFSESYQRVLCGGYLGAERWVYQYLPDGTFVQKHPVSGGWGTPLLSLTGLAARDDHLFLSTENLPLFLSCAYRFVLPDLTGITAYRTYSGGYTVTRDITLNAEGNVWVAADHATHSARLYNASHQMADYVSTALVPHASGMAMCPDGFLWMADPVNDLLYKVDLEVGLEGSLAAAVPGLTVNTSANPFVGSVALFVEGALSFEVEIFDLCGRRVTYGSAEGSWVWDGMLGGRPAPSGCYLALVRAEHGAVAGVTLVRI